MHHKSRLTPWLFLPLLVLGFVGGSSVVSASSGVTIEPRSTGYFLTDMKYMAEGEPSEPVRAPILFFVIRHPKGVVLFDSGLGTEFPEQVAGWWANRLVERLIPCEFDPSQAAVIQLKAMGISPGDVKFIIVSHLHYDHAGGLRDFPAAKIVVSRAEWEYANVPRWRARLRGVMSEQLKGVKDRLLIIDYEKSRADHSVEPFEAAHDFFGDGSLVLLSTPGHTPGHQSLLVTTGSGKRVLLAGDAVWVRENYERPTPKSFWIRHLEENDERAWKTTRLLHQFAVLHPDVLVIPSHDPHLWRSLPKRIE